MVGAERKETYRGFELSQVDWYYQATQDGRQVFTAGSVATLRRMIDSKLSGGWFARSR